jgi:hypothetical protein
MDCATAWLNTFAWAPGLLNDAQSSPLATVSPVGVAFMPTHMLWLAMRRCARRQVSSLSLSLKCSWMVSIRWTSVAK